MHYHTLLIDTFCGNLDYFALGFRPEYCMRNVRWEQGEIDVIVGSELERALVEVKCTADKLSDFTDRQFERYREFDPEASVYLLMGTEDHSLEIERMRFIRFHPL